MSYPNDNNNPWVSLADILLKQKPIDVAPLATAIEKHGIYTWDRFGRMIMATKGDGNDSCSIMHALDLLAFVYKKSLEAQEAKDSGDGGQEMLGLDNYIEEYDGPLVRFGWPSGQCPDFDKYQSEQSAPSVVLKARQPDEDDLLGPKERTSLYVIIRALIKMAKISTDPFEPFKLGGAIAEESDKNGEGIGSQTIGKHLKKIFDQR